MQRLAHSRPSCHPVNVPQIYHTPSINISRLEGSTSCGLETFLIITASLKEIELNIRIDAWFISVQISFLR